MFSGSVWCATLEVKVGRSDWPTGRDYETLAYTVNLMSPVDCAQARNTSKTQMFSSGLLVELCMDYCFQISVYTCSCGQLTIKKVIIIIILCNL